MLAAPQLGVPTPRLATRPLRLAAHASLLHDVPAFEGVRDAHRFAAPLPRERGARRRHCLRARTAVMARPIGSCGSCQAAHRCRRLPSALPSSPPPYFLPPAYFLCWPVGVMAWSVCVCALVRSGPVRPCVGAEGGRVGVGRLSHGRPAMASSSEFGRRSVRRRRRTISSSSSQATAARSSI